MEAWGISLERRVWRFEVVSLVISARAVTNLEVSTEISAVKVALVCARVATVTRSWAVAVARCASASPMSWWLAVSVVAW